MTNFHPPVQERDNEDLIFIVISPKGDWQNEIVNQANDELLKRGITAEQIEEVKQNYEHYLQLEEEKTQEQFRINEVIGYERWQLLLIFFFSIFILLGKGFGLSGMSLTELKQEHFYKKHNQRLFALISGAVAWLILFQILNRL